MASAAGSRPTSNGGRSTRAKGSLAAVLVAWLFVVFDGYDLIVYGTVLPKLMEPQPEGFGVSATVAGTLGSLAFAGMMVGALIAGRLADAFGRKWTIIGCAVVLTIFTVACGFVDDAWLFGALRFLAGLGLGGLVPSANALAADLVPARWRATVATLMMSGVPIGGSIAALVGIPIIPAYGWRPMFWLAAIAIVVFVPLALIIFPDDRPSRIAPHHHLHDDNPDLATTTGYGALLRPPFLNIGLLFAAATVVTLMAWYGLGTWLPKLLAQSGYQLGAALMLTLALNLGAVLGSVVTAWAGDRIGTIPTGVTAALLAGVALLLLVLQPPVWAVYVILILAGVGTHGTQCLIIAAIATYFPERLRGTALGFGLGMGRIGAVLAPQTGGLLLAAGLGVNSNYILFGGCALAAAAVLAVVWANYGVTHDSVGPVGRRRAMEDQAVM